MMLLTIHKGKQKFDIDLTKDWSGQIDAFLKWSSQFGADTQAKMMEQIDAALKAFENGSPDVIKHKHGNGLTTLIFGRRKEK